MKFILTKKQFSLINEQLGYTQGYPEIMKTSFEEFKKQHPLITNLMLNMSLWFVPYVGPYLVAAKGTYEGIDDIQKGNYFMGVVQIITSPLGIGKFLRFAKLSGLPQTEFITMLETIYKSGIPVLTSEGIEQFFRWGFINFGDKFRIFVENLEDTKNIQTYLDTINYEERKKVKEKEKTKKENNEPKPNPNFDDREYSYDRA